ncbi:MAG TPA: MATE family efflux transporter [Bacteroidales bacterium]|nr:MATE family efflux transporter [Bacteroidales bacterium]
MQLNQRLNNHKPGGIHDLLAIALPMVVSTAADGVMTFTDRLFLARVGSEQMNAALGGGVSYQMLLFFFMGLTGYSTALVAQYYGSGALRKAPQATFQAIIITLIAWPVILLLKPLAQSFFYTMHLSTTQIHYQIQYMDVLAWGGLFGMLRMTMGCFFAGIGKSKIVMVASVTAMLVNVTLDYILIFGKFGFPAMGVQGAALATVIGGLSALILLLAAYFSPDYRIRFDIGHSFRFQPAIMKKLIKYGYPAGLEMFLNFLAFFLMTAMYQSQGQAEATAVTIMFNYDLVSFIPLIGIEIAVTSLAGRYMGAGRPQAAHRSALSAIKTGMVYSVLILILFLLIPETLVRVFHPHEYSAYFETAVPIAVDMIRIASLYVLAQAIMVSLIGTLRGAGDTFYTMMVSVGASWTFIPLLYLCLYVFHTSVPFAWFIIVAIYLIFCFVIYKRFKSEKWKKLQIIK